MANTGLSERVSTNDELSSGKTGAGSCSDGTGKLKQDHFLSSARAPRNFWRCQFVYAFIAFVVLSQWAALASFGALPPGNFSFHSWTASAIEAFQKTPPEHPSLVFLGSSLLLVPFNSVDADFGRRPIDCSEHHTSDFFASQLEARSGEKVSVFSFALPGEMPSDSYLLCRYFLKHDRKPETLIVGIGPRDFIDATLKSPMSTDPYQQLARYGSLNDQFAWLAHEWDEKFTLLLKQCIYIYRYQEDLALRFRKSVEQVVANMTPGTVKPISLSLRRELIPDYHFWEIGKGDQIVRPSTPQTAGKFYDNTSEYRVRYRAFPTVTFAQQTHFFDLLLQLARERGMKVLVVEMPATQEALRLIPAQSLKLYRDTVASIVDKDKAELIDLQNNSGFDRTDFADIVHLNARGGRKFLSLLAKDAPLEVGAKNQ